MHLRSRHRFPGEHIVSMGHMGTGSPGHLEPCFDDGATCAGTSSEVAREDAIVLRDVPYSQLMRIAPTAPHGSSRCTCGGLRRWRISLPALKNGTDFCLTATTAPVAGLRPP
jgi:hypothetical protein